MPLTPDLPFPKAAGHTIRSKDWNDVVTEVQRLDNAKVNRAGADALAGPLTIAAALGVGTTTPAAGTRLHVVDSANPAVLRIQSTAAFGAARMEMWSDPQGPNEWRPGYIQSFDLGSWTGGLSFVTNGTSQAQKTGALEAMRVVNGKVGIAGVTNPDHKLEVGDRMRLRQGANGTAGLWLYSTGTSNDRAFIGLANDNVVGFWGNHGPGWALQMDVTTGNVGIKRAPEAASGSALSITGDLRVSGRMRDNSLRSQAAAGNQIQTTSSGYLDIPNMSLTINLPASAQVLILFHMPGVQIQGANSNNGAANFRILVDGTSWAFTRNEWHNNGWELRSIHLDRLVSLGAGNHTITVQWACTNGGTMTGCWYGDTRTLSVLEFS
jgi:hypothetical protein